ncbi:MAG: ABC-F family ATP-binding cassette domain-containing protein, partial [Cytophagales bacterium]
LSGGQKKRVAMAMMLLENPELFLLDEPTNHLDLEAIEWLENHLNGHKITLLMVTHDRYFLDNVCNQIFELEKGTLHKHEGNYAYFLEKKAEREAMLQSTVDKAKNLLTKELDWMRRQPKARGTKAKYRIDAFHELEKVAKQDLSKAELEINIQTARQGNKVLELNGISKKFENKLLFSPFNYIFRKKDRIGLVGKNGTGKSTLLQIITGKLKPDTGEAVPGQTTRFAYFSQHAEDLNDENRIIDEVQEIAEYVTLGNGDQVSVSKLLEMFLFPVPMQYTPVAKLSGGERKRLQLLKILVTNPNFLILDEPTNDLDLDTLNVLEDFLENFNGCLLLVSHDRYFMDKLVDHIFVIENQKITDFNGNYSDFRNAKEEEEKEKAKSLSKPVATKEETKKENSNSKKAQQLEKEINLLESQKAQLETELNQSGISLEKLNQLSEKHKQLLANIELKTEEWFEAQK